MERAMKKRPKRKSAKPPPERSGRTGRRPGAGRKPAPPPAAPGPLQYKVVELSTVDEGALERALNTWTAQGWNLDGVQFAMRESSKRPAMAFVFFTREGTASVQEDVPPEDGARARLQRLAEQGSPTAALLQDAPLAPVPVRAVSAHERLMQLAGMDGSEPREEGLTLEPDWGDGESAAPELELSPGLASELDLEPDL
jgi:hypothetical protein